MPPIFFAPMEGVTDAVFRRVHRECFPGLAGYGIPFLSPTQNLILTPREKRDLLPENNTGVPCIPQVLTRNPDHFLWAAAMLKDYGYEEVNLNAGCPSATVTAKGKGAGILKDPAALDHFLDQVCSQSPLPVSVKTRIGFETTEEWPTLLKIYTQYPLKRLMIHPRTCRERYDPDTVHPECWQEALEAGAQQPVYNGDLFSAADPGRLKVQEASGYMLGRGLLANPALGREIQGGNPIRKEEIIHFHDRLAEEWLVGYHPNAVFNKMRVVMKHLACCFAETGKLEKKIRKSRDLKSLLEIDRQLFDSCELKEKPAFVPDGLRSLFTGAPDPDMDAAES